MATDNMPFRKLACSVYNTFVNKNETFVNMESLSALKELTEFQFIGMLH